MKRKDYEKPTMQVVELPHRTMILAGSGGDAQGKSATMTVTYTEEDI